MSREEAAVQHATAPENGAVHQQQEEHDDENDYTGPAEIVLADGTEVAVEVTLRGHFQPIDGYYHWYGRIAANAELSERLGGKKAEARVRTPQGEAAAKLTDPDPWGRYRITGTSTPPFAVFTEEA